MKIDEHTRKVAEALPHRFNGECTTKLCDLPPPLVDRFCGGGGGGGGGSGSGSGDAMSILLLSGRSGSGKSAAIGRAFPGRARQTLLATLANSFQALVT